MANKNAALTRLASTQGMNGAAIIFVHGLGGAPGPTWQKMFDCFEGDSAFDDWTLDCFTYPTRMFQLPFTPSPPGLLDLADGLRTFIEERHGDRSAIHLVAHSLGGLVARQFLISEINAARAHKVKKLALVAVPSTGSALAKVGSTVSFRHRQLKRLTRDDDGLRGLNTSWNQLAVEDRVDVRYVVGGCDRAVPHDSAVPVHGRDNKSMLINEDHRSIVKPEDCDDIRYQTIRRFLLATKSAPAAAIPSSPPAAAMTPITTASPDRVRAPTPTPFLRAADPLFEAYTPKEEPFYIARTFDDVLMQSFSASHIWITGASGVGKTSALRRAVYQNGWHLNQVTLAPYEVASATQLFRAMCVEFGSLAGLPEIPPPDAPASDLFQHLKKILRHFPADLTIANIVEEMPVDPGCLVEFADLVAKFLSALVGESDLYGRVQFAFSSLREVHNGSQQPSPKSREYIQMLKIDSWSVRDAERLVELLASTLRPDLNDAEFDALVVAASGSPRFIKHVFRLLRAGACAGASFEDVIERVRQEQAR